MHIIAYFSGAVPETGHEFFRQVDYNCSATVEHLSEFGNGIQLHAFAWLGKRSNGRLTRQILAVEGGSAPMRCISPLEVGT